MLSFSFCWFIISVEKCNWFLCIDFAALLNLFISSSSFFVEWSGKLEFKHPTVSTISRSSTTRRTAAPSITFPQCLSMTCGLWVKWIWVRLGFYMEVWCFLCFSGMLLTYMMFWKVIDSPVISNIQPYIHKNKSCTLIKYTPKNWCWHY